ncbi:MAG: chemotaxis sensory transducer, partial [Proteobacteria bacterium]|nr:chemotaxis sensory transducer [Pseudomonadota bacterium]
ASANVAEAVRAASGSKTKANEVLESAREMSRQSETLAREVARFLGEIRAA